MQCIKCHNTTQFYLVEITARLILVNPSGQLECGEPAEPMSRDQIQCAQCGCTQVQVSASGRPA